MNKLFGRIIKKNNNIVTVLIKKSYLSKKYKKRIFYYNKIKVFDMFKESNYGDYVMINKSRPISKTIFWILIKILEKVRLI